jgi:hypothetical protein
MRPTFRKWAWTYVCAVLFGSVLLAAFTPTRQHPKQRSILIYGVSYGDNARPAWEYVKRCSGEKEKRGGRYEDIKFFLTSPHALDDSTSTPAQRTLGRWVAPDTILIDSLYRNSMWVVAHEMLHHLRQQGGHPPVPFEKPCALMGSQNMPLGEP